MIIGFGHQKRVGKDSAVGFLQKHYSFERLSFADQLKLSAGRMFMLSDAQLYGTAKEAYDERWDTSARDIMQRYGTILRNEFGHDFWIKLVGLHNDEAFTSSNFALADVRYINEAEWVQKQGGLMFKIVREGLIENTDDHPSEQELAGWTGWNGIITNKGSLSNFEATVLKAVAPYL